MSTTIGKKGALRRGSVAEGKIQLVGLMMPMTTEGTAELPYLSLYLEEPLRQIDTIKGGIPAAMVKLMVVDFDIDQGGFLSALNLKTATLNRRAAKDEKLPADESERVVGLARLVGQVEAMVRDSGNPEGFNAAEWLSRWLREPLPALGGRKPITLLDTMAGQALVSQALSRLQSGAYA